MHPQFSKGRKGRANMHHFNPVLKPPLGDSFLTARESNARTSKGLKTSAKGFKFNQKTTWAP